MRTRTHTHAYMHTHVCARTHTNSCAHALTLMHTHAQTRELHGLLIALNNAQIPHGFLSYAMGPNEYTQKHSRI